MEVDAAQLLAEHGRNPFSGFVPYEAPWQWFETDAGAPTLGLLRSIQALL